VPLLGMDCSSKLVLKNRNRIAKSGNPYGRPKYSKSFSYVL